MKKEINEIDDRMKAIQTKIDVIREHQVVQKQESKLESQFE